MVGIVYGFIVGNYSYVGCSFNFENRKLSHQTDLLENKKSHKYRKIRNAGYNFNDIDWFILNTYPDIYNYENKEHRKKLAEQEYIWYLRIKPNLNSKNAFLYGKEKKNILKKKITIL